ncbi:malonyl-CoA decarboxylase-domain-containing protein [Polychytrium aggregatum]|uniref:malonyl-CoA decarboxylase-domain-containing protein n=1 Tax=Polychytrium aggregatum TaxID=110093 RepID=UPI0022FE8CC5|nr:malonyl-CoA decarboxylase-domain-containing protein [Polychytrium aggregatum]KAI9207465.1 malonyl-CoA decarboxylase-domain-containing protein [Polychytrium aggregatum]
MRCFRSRPAGTLLSSRLGQAPHPLLWLARRSAHSQRPPSTPLPSTIVANYWDDVIRYSKDPNTYTMSDGTHEYSEKNAQFVRRLLSGSIRTRRESGDIMPALVTRQCCEFYESCNPHGKSEFLKVLAKDFGVDRAETISAARKYLEAEQGSKSSSVLHRRVESALRSSLAPLYDSFFTKVHRLPGGMRFLVNLRKDLVNLISEDSTHSLNHELRAMSEYLREKFQAWFDTETMDLKRITWNSEASVLEKVVEYEAVHPIPDWKALKQRLGPGRLCYGFFHSGLPLTPLTFIEIALVDKVSNNIHDIIESTPTINDEKQANTAIFYSITSSQKGLTGVELGNFLIKRVVKELQRDYPQITTFCTLSPVPGFRPWLETQMNLVEDRARSKPLFLAQEVHSLCTIRDKSDANAAQVLRELTSDDAWMHVPASRNLLEPILLRLCAKYILTEKKRMFCFDPVANFHIRNGASVARINWQADRSDKGIRQSYGMMVNYQYLLDQVEENNKHYLMDGSIHMVDPLEPTLWLGEQPPPHL